MLVLMSASLKAQYVTNHAAKFNGTNSYISFGSSMENDLRNGYTLEAWVYYSHVQGPQKIIFEIAAVKIARPSFTRLAFHCHHELLSRARPRG